MKDRLLAKPFLERPRSRVGVHKLHDSPLAHIILIPKKFIKAMTDYTEAIRLDANYANISRSLRRG